MSIYKSSVSVSCKQIVLWSKEWIYMEQMTKVGQHTWHLHTQTLWSIWSNRELHSNCLRCVWRWGPAGQHRFSDRRVTHRVDLVLIFWADTYSILFINPDWRWLSVGRGLIRLGWEVWMLVCKTCNKTHPGSQTVLSTHGSLLETSFTFFTVAPLCWSDLLCYSVSTSVGLLLGLTKLPKCFCKPGFIAVVCAWGFSQHTNWYKMSASGSLSRSAGLTLWPQI